MSDIGTSLQLFPSVECPGCKIAMKLKDLRPVMFAPRLYTGTYRCERCGTETKREFRNDLNAKVP
jgi:DNA-directed RNA polymerase subunit RPC12/RpoP